MRVKCSFCSREAVTRIEYARLNLCQEHYVEFIEKKVERSIEKYGLLKTGYKVLVALSGGKDSSTALAILAKLSKKMNLKIYGLHINLGLGEYSKKCLDSVRELASRFNIKLYVFDLVDTLGSNISEIALKSRRPPCSVCGIIKRYLMNAFAIELGVDTIVTGHNLDDIMTYMLKEFLNQNLQGVAKLLPKTESIKDLVVGRARILYDVYEEEVLRYVKYSGVPYTEMKCPYSKVESIEKLIKKFINELENNHPSMKLGFVRRVFKNKEYYLNLGENNYMKCSVCGLVSSSNLCSFCKLTKRVFGEPKGPYIREKIREIILGC